MLFRSRLAEARWWLGRSYEQMGEYRTAMAEYRMLVTGDAAGDAETPVYQQQALQRLDQLRQVPGGLAALPARRVALALPLSRLPPVSAWVAWLQTLLKIGVTTVLLDPSDTDRSAERNPESIEAFIGAAHLAGLSVWGAVDPYQGGGVALRPEWLSRSLAVQDEMLLRAPDPVHPDYQAVIEARAIQLLRAGCDGLFFKAREAQGYAQDFTGQSFERFSSAFGLTLTPQQLFGEPAGGEPMVYDRESTYWRWVGWKARSYVTMAARIRKLMRDINPAGRLLLEVHGRTVREPLVGLEQFGEDLTDMFQRSGGDLVVRAEETAAPVLLDQLAQQLGSSDRLWLVRPVVIPDATPVAEWTEEIGRAHV